MEINKDIIIVDPDDQIALGAGEGTDEIRLPLSQAGWLLRSAVEHVLTEYPRASSLESPFREAAMAREKRAQRLPCIITGLIGFMESAEVEIPPEVKAALQAVQGGDVEPATSAEYPSIVENVLEPAGTR